MGVRANVIPPEEIVGILPYLVKSQGNIASIIACIACIIASIIACIAVHYCKALSQSIEGYKNTMQYGHHWRYEDDADYR
jgi:hypothetical protein